MRVILVRAKATMQFLEMSCIVNDDVAMECAQKLRELDKRDEWRVDIMIPEPSFNDTLEMMKEMTKE